MKKSISALCTLCSFLFLSCIPVKLAPSIDEHKLVLAKKFKRDLPRHYAFVFEDTKQADEFYHFVNLKFNLQHRDVETNVPLVIGDKVFYMSFFEREKTSEFINLVPIVIDGILDTKGVGPILQETYSTRSGYWYIVITVADPDFQDALAPEYIFRNAVVRYLDELQDEYFNTHHYLELTMKK